MKLKMYWFSNLFEQKLYTEDLDIAIVLMHLPKVLLYIFCLLKG